MRGKLIIFVVSASLAMLCHPTTAELQDVEVGGLLTIYGEYTRNAEPVADFLYNGRNLGGRPIGYQGGRIPANFGYSSDSESTSTITQWTRVNVNAEFTEGVRAFIEFDSQSVWGEDFRSKDWESGVDNRATFGENEGAVEVYQAYIEANGLFGLPLRMRIGRQEMAFGTEWLVGKNDNGTVPTYGLSFDAIRFSYGDPTYSLDIFAAKLHDSVMGNVGKNDVDFYGAYLSMEAMEDVTMDFYYFLLRDDSKTKDNYTGFWSNFEDLFGLERSYDTTNLHTAGTRVGGVYGAVDFEVEMAYQWGEADAIGMRFAPSLYGNNNAEFDAWATNIEVGYEVGRNWLTRCYLGYAHFSGEDNRDISQLDWLESLVNPYYTRQASISFNRLFSNWCYSNVLDCTDLSNVQVFRGGADAQVTENVDILLDVAYLKALDSFDVPTSPWFPWVTEEADDELGWEVCLSVLYEYSEDLYFLAGWDHLFVGDGLTQGNFVLGNGLDSAGGSGNKDVDYIFFESGLSF